MSLSTFRAFQTLLETEGGLVATRYHSPEMQLCLYFSYVCGGLSNRSLSHRFHLSGSTISRYMRLVLNAINRVQAKYIYLPDPYELQSTLLPGSHNEPFLMPYFRDCLGALDGTHIEARVSEQETFAFRNRTGRVTQNVLGACDLQGRFVFALAGWEGSVEDVQVLNDALEKGFEVPVGKYYLADAAYNLSMSVLTPFRGVRYQFVETGLSPQNYQELFNHRHAMARSVIDRQFRSLRRRFLCFATPSQYPFQVQTKFVKSCLVVHNFLSEIEPEPLDIALQDDYFVSEGILEDDDRHDDDQEAIDFRDGIAQQMWQDYQHALTTI